MKSLIDIVLDNIHQQDFSSKPAFEQIEILGVIADRLGLPEGKKQIVEGRDSLVAANQQVREHEATLFRLKQIGGLLLDKTMSADKRMTLELERSNIMQDIRMPAGVPISDFAAESAENAGIVKNLMRGLRDGTLHLS